MHEQAASFGKSTNTDQKQGRSNENSLQCIMSNYLYFLCLSLLLWIINTFNQNIKCTVMEMVFIESFFIYFFKKVTRCLSPYC